MRERGEGGEREREREREKEREREEREREREREREERERERERERESRQFPILTFHLLTNSSSLPLSLFCPFVTWFSNYQLIHDSQTSSWVKCSRN